jgi:site-specific DNA recombinase
MKTYYAYVRVSTARQGVEGVSLQEQRASIMEYAERRGMGIAEWFEDRVTAAKRGRPVFSKLVSTLKAKRTVGVVIHKIDRGARNLRDWADIAELMDRGIDVHFAHESIDLHSRSGRLSADILAVVASDYIRNLREETIKGINGRLKQGLYPFSAPLGYINTGRGKVKTVDPVQGPLVKQLFERYASKEYSLQGLEDEMFRRGLRNSKGKIVPMNQLATTLRNPFYMGLMRIQGRKDMYPGIHTPLIASSLFNRVQSILDHRRSNFRQPHRYAFSMLIRCKNCRRYLVGETHKGHVYYRCHRKMCVPTCLRQERFEEAIMAELKRINISPEEEAALQGALLDFRNSEAEIAGKVREEVKDELSRVQASLNALLQKFLDDQISKDTFDEANACLLMQRRGIEEKLSSLDSSRDAHVPVEAFLSELRGICRSFSAEELNEKRRVAERFFIGITTNHRLIGLTMNPSMAAIAGREKTKNGWLNLFPMIYKNTA